jgi:hypothetical protein
MLKKVTRPDNLFIEKLYEKTVVGQNHCRLWRGATNAKGYAVTKFLGKNHYVHRLVFAFHYGLLDIDFVHHTCSTKNCINIDHLQNATALENNLETMERNFYKKQISEQDKILEKLYNEINIQKLEIQGLYDRLLDYEVR